jgi:hypothetical protein
MIRTFEEVNKDWTFFDWDEWDSVRHKIGEDKFDEIKDDLYDILKHVYGVGFEEGFVDARHCWYKYIDKVRNIVMNFFKGVMKENKDSKEDILKFVYKIIEIDTDDIIMNKDEN